MSVSRVFPDSPKDLIGPQQHAPSGQNQEPPEKGASGAQAVRRRVRKTWVGGVLEEKGETSRWVRAAGAGRGCLPGWALSWSIYNKTPGTGWLVNSRNLFLPILEAGSPGCPAPGEGQAWDGGPPLCPQGRRREPREDTALGAPSCPLGAALRTHAFPRPAGQHRLEGRGTVGGSQEATPSVSSPLFLETWDFTAL